MLTTPLNKLNQLTAWFRLSQAESVRSIPLLRLCILLIGCSTLLMAILPGQQHDLRWNLLVGLSVLSMLLFVKTDRWFYWYLVIILLLPGVFIFWVATYSGGINSIVMLWWIITPVPALLLGGARFALIWLIGVIISLLSLFLVTYFGWVNPEVIQRRSAIPWTLASHLLCVSSLFLVMMYYEKQHQWRLRKLEHANLHLKNTHTALEMAQQHKEEFIAAVGHELRAPMTAILGLNSVLRESLQDAHEHVEIVDHIRRSTQQLLQVINNILDYSQLQSGKLSIQSDWNDLQSILDFITQQCNEKAQNKQQDFRTYFDERLPIRVWLDRARLVQIIGNLVDNACKFTPAQGTITLRVISRGDWLHFEIEDHGPGVPLAHVKTIFNRFEHTAPESTSSQGAGVGLAICERLVQMQSGHIGVKNALHGGALFWFELPMESPTELDLAFLAEQEAIDRHTPLNLLLVDDDPVNLMIGKMQLKKCWPQATIITANGGKAALEQLLKRSFDIALVDMIMPEVSGLELTQWVRSQHRPNLAQLPILGLTASSHPDDWDRCLAAGMNGVMIKPLDPEEGVRSIRRHIRRSRRHI